MDDEFMDLPLVERMKARLAELQGRRIENKHWTIGVDSDGALVAVNIEDGTETVLAR